MKVVKGYVRIVVALLASVLFWGLIAPICVSSQSNFLVFIGICSVFAVPVLWYWILKPLWTKVSVIPKEEPKKSKEPKNAKKSAKKSEPKKQTKTDKKNVKSKTNKNEKQN